MAKSTAKRIHIIGRKNSGKTTLVVELVAGFTRRGYCVETIIWKRSDNKSICDNVESRLHIEPAKN